MFSKSFWQIPWLTWALYTSNRLEIEGKLNLLCSPCKHKELRSHGSVDSFFSV